MAESLPQIKVKLLRALRFPLSQKDFSQQLGFRFNCAVKWETQQKLLSWSQFCLICKFRKIDMVLLLKEVFCLQLFDSSAQVVLQKFIDLYHQDESIESLAQRWGVHSSALRRWMRGKGEPTFEEMCRLFQLATQLLNPFLTKVIEQCLPGSAEAAFEAHWDSAWTDFSLLLADMRNLETRIPYLSAIQGALFLESYEQLPEHDDRFVAQKTGLTLLQVQLALQILQQRKWITWNEESKKFKSIPLRVDMGGHPLAEVLQLGEYWTTRAGSHWRRKASNLALQVASAKKTNPSFLSYRIVPASKESQQKINELLVQFDQKILQILEADPNPLDEVRVLLVQHFSTE